MLREAVTESEELINWFGSPGSEGCDGGTRPLWTAETKGRWWKHMLYESQIKNTNSDCKFIYSWYKQ